MQIHAMLLFSMSPAHRKSIRLEMRLRTIPLVIRLNSFRLINSQRKVDSLFRRLKSSLDKHLSGLVWAGDILITCRGSLLPYFPWRLSAPTLTISTALKENMPTKVHAVLPSEGTENKASMRFNPNSGAVQWQTHSFPPAEVGTYLDFFPRGQCLVSISWHCYHHLNCEKNNRMSCSSKANT